jgi:hypothetical protein
MLISNALGRNWLLILKPPKQTVGFVYVVPSNILYPGEIHYILATRITKIGNNKPDIYI